MIEIVILVVYHTLLLIYSKGLKKFKISCDQIMQVLINVKVQIPYLFIEAGIILPL